MMGHKAWILFGIAVFFLVSGFLLGYGVKKPSLILAPGEEVPVSSSSDFSGTVVSLGSDNLFVLKGEDGLEKKVSYDRSTNFVSKFQGLEDEDVAISSGLQVRFLGEEKNGVINAARTIEVLDAPEKLVYSPVAGQSVGSPFIVSGVARAFENQFSWRLKDVNGKILDKGVVYADAKDVGYFGRYEIRASYPSPETKEGTVEVFDNSAKDGREIDLVSVPVVFDAEKTVPIKIFFSDNEAMNTTFDCETVRPVRIFTDKVESPARSAVEELLKGLHSNEAPAYFDVINKRAFFLSTGIPEEARLLSISLNEGVMKADFSNSLQEMVGGSCRVAGIVSQIRNTLMQFSNVKKAEICIEGNCDRGLILQP